MIIAAHQPNFLPNLSFFYKMAQVDLFVIITNIQFEKQEAWQQRQRITGPQGDVWLTVPVLGSQNQKIKDVKINNTTRWRQKHRKTIECNYAKFSEHEFKAKIKKIYASDWERLVDLNVTVINFLKEKMHIQTPVILDEEVDGKKHELLINICKKYNANTYLSGSGGKNYMTETYFSEMEKRKITCRFIEKNITGTYPYSSIHYLLTKGPKWVSQVLSGK